MKTRLLIIIAYVGVFISIPHAFASESQAIQIFQPDVELLPDQKIVYGESFTIHAWLQSYENRPDGLGFHVDVLDPQYKQVDSTLWFAKSDFVYEFDTTHPAYNITQSGNYYVQLEEANFRERTGSFPKTITFEVLFPEPEQDEFVSDKCGPGTSLQDGICIVDEIGNPITSSSRWDAKSINQIAVLDVIPPPLKQMELGIKLGHVICDKDKTPVWNIHYNPACVFPETESELIKRGWAKLRLLLPAGPDPVKEMDWMGRNVMSMMLEGTFSYSSTSVETLDEKKTAIDEYSEQYHLGEQYLEYAIIPNQYHYAVGDKIQFELLEWGKTSNCSNLQLRIIDMNDQPVFEYISKNLCGGTNVPLVIYNSYSMGDYFDEFVCDDSGYYRIQVTNGDTFPPTILQNFACLESGTDSLRPDDRLQVRHSAGYTTVYITLSSWDEYHDWEEDRGEEHDAMPPLVIDDDNINPIVFDLLKEMWKFEDYDVSEHDNTLFIKTVQKDYSVPNHHGIHDWLESEYAKQFGESNDGFGSYFEYKDNVYSVAMVAVD